MAEKIGSCVGASYISSDDVGHQENYTPDLSRWRMRPFSMYIREDGEGYQNLYNLQSRECYQLKPVNAFQVNRS